MAGPYMGTYVGVHPTVIRLMTVPVLGGQHNSLPWRALR